MCIRYYIICTPHHGKGPVHINVPISEPIYRFTAKTLLQYTTIASNLHHSRLFYGKSRKKYDEIFRPPVGGYDENAHILFLCRGVQRVSSRKWAIFCMAEDADLLGYI